MGGRSVQVKRSPVVGKVITRDRGVVWAVSATREWGMNRILVVDDSQRICRFVARALEANGFQFDVAGNGYEALRLVESQDYAVIVLDLLLPGIDGYEVLRRVLRGNQAQRVLIMSAIGEVESKVSCLLLWVVVYIPVQIL